MMAIYHTEGIIKDVELTSTDGTFTLEASAPYSIEKKFFENDGTTSGLDVESKGILFIADDGDTCQEATDAGTKVKIVRTAFLVSDKTRFSFQCGEKVIDIPSLLLLKQNRTRIRIAVKGTLKPGSAPSNSSTQVVSSMSIM